MNLHLNRATRARLYLTTLRALGAPDSPITSEDYMAHGYAEAITSDYPEDSFALSRATDAFVAGELHRSDYQYATVDPTALNEDKAVVSIALKLAGFVPSRVAGGVRWTDAPDNEPTLKIQLPESFEL